MKRLIVMLLAIVCLPSSAQIVANADAVTTQLNINRDEKGFKTCGVRVVAATMDQKSGSIAYDFSINLWDDANGLIKAGQQSIPFDKSKGWDVHKLSVKTPGPESVWIGKRDENLTIKPIKYIKSDDPGYVLGGSDGIATIKMIIAIAAGEPMQVALRFSKEKYDRVISFKATMTEDDRTAVHSCLTGLAERMKQEGPPNP